MGRGTGGSQCLRFGMRLPGRLRPALPDHDAVSDDHAADVRIGPRMGTCPLRQRHGTGHPALVPTHHRFHGAYDGPTRRSTA